MRISIRHDSVSSERPRELVLWGAGHAHVEVLRRFARRPEPGLRLTLVTREPHTPHAGMLAGLIRGDYEFDATHIDLGPLAAAAGARLIVTEATGLDLVARTLTFPDRPALPFDLLSINIGGEALTAEGTGTPVKPIGRLLARLAEIEPSLHPETRLAIVGAGVAGTELALALAHRLAGQVGIALISAGALPLPGAPQRARLLAREALVDAGVELLSNVQAGVFHNGRLSLSDGSYLEAAAALWATGVGAFPALASAGLACDALGAIRVDRGLRSLTHPYVFAAGDCAAMADALLPKSALWAARAGATLAENLRRAARGKVPRPLWVRGQDTVILGLGHGRALGWRNGITLTGQRLWRLKDHLDRRRIARLQVSAPSSAGRPVLALPAGPVAPGMAAAAWDGAAMAAVPPPGYAVIQHVDHLPTCIDDPLVQGQIAASQALSGLFVAGAHPWTATALLTRTGLAEADIEAMLFGANRVLAAAGCSLTGVRAIDGPVPALGFALTGLVDPETSVWSSGPRVGDVLVLTKPLGGAVVLAGARAGRSRARWRQAAIASMRRTNAEAMPILRAHGASAGTDLSGGGLLTRLDALLRPSGLVADIDPAAVPALPGARDLLGKDGDEALLKAAELSGGLVAAIPATLAESCRDELRRAGHAAAIIGALGPAQPAAGIAIGKSGARPASPHRLNYSRPEPEPALPAAP